MIAPLSILSYSPSSGESNMADAKTSGSPAVKWIMALVLVLLAVYMYMRR